MTTPGSAPRTRLLLLDFDGTVCLGDDPVLAYAARVDAILTERGQQPLIRDAVARAFAADDLLVEEIAYDEYGVPLGVEQEPGHRLAADGTAHSAHPVSWPVQDGYQLVQLLARQAGLSDVEAGQAFLGGREDLLARGLESTDVHAPDGLAELLEQVRRTALVVLVTNSPAGAFAPWLRALGLTEAFDAVINDARKPFGMPEALRLACAVESPERPIAADQVLSVGDIWRNDLAPVAALGGTTLLLDRFATGLGEPDHRARRVADAVDIIGSWAGQESQLHGGVPG
ncbi:HAD family hydrolase [Nesterenkonia xinjiangensis]|uniref:FMN phosphatase YigB (HAD superfamily) n=1 Tax=Nesterenkonia xinjiangensis TaxID=225327 RepID=A0A7Z0GLU4_9MICC|nr:HAD family hydrolase [Nesterenkonia xinjiangensis]NYJ78377.1 FMN phosphatase YigB (HAD superfamily) [Nesterenkonia xinjiangensis]